MKRLEFTICLLCLLVLSKATSAQCILSKDYTDNHYDSTQADFSKELYDSSSNNFKNRRPAFSRFRQYGFGHIWINRGSLEGIVGLNYQRLQVVILTEEPLQSNPPLYKVSGKIKYKGAIEGFSGDLFVITGFMNTSDPTEIDSNTHGTVYATYKFELDDKSATLQGITTTDFILNTSTQEAVADTTEMGDDDYADDTFVGTWTEHNSTKPLKCIFGIGRLPFCFDFDKGDGDMVPSDRYRKNGWQNYPDDKWINAPTGTVPVKWWETK